MRGFAYDATVAHTHTPTRLVPCTVLLIEMSFTAATVSSTLNGRPCVVDICIRTEITHAGGDRKLFVRAIRR